MTPHHTIPSVSRRAALAGIVGGSLGIAVLPAGDRAFAQEASPEAMVSHPVVGTWVLQFEDPSAAPVVGVWGADGSFIDAGSGHAGVWEATGPQTALHTWVHVFSQNNNYVVVSGTIEVDPSGDSWTQAYSSMVVSAGGMVLNTGTGVAHARRLRPVPEDALNAPLDVVPTWTPAEATPAS